MKDIKELEQELGNLLSKYCNQELIAKRLDNWIDEHDFYGILNSCEELINKINKVEENE